MSSSAPGRPEGLDIEIGDMLVTAPPGCGKTEFMARRARDLVRAGMIRPPRKILVVTFSNRAKDNLKHRVSCTLGPNFDHDVTVTNFHGLGLRLLTNHGNVIGRTIDDTRHPLPGSLRRLRNQICAEYDTNQNDLGKVLRWAKSGPYTDDDVLERLASGSAAAVEYERRLRTQGRVDFDDALRLGLLIVRNPSVAELYREHFACVFVDEVQDLAGYDLDILAALARSSARLLMVGDPRQVTYLTHHERRYQKYADGGIVAFLREELPRKVLVEIDETSLNRTHRNSAAICAVSSRLFPALPAGQACQCVGCRGNPLVGAGVFVLRTADYAHYLASVRPMQLRDSINSAGVDTGSPVMNFGESKGRGFDHVVVLPTTPMKKWLVDPTSELKAQSRAKFYVALTRGRLSVAVAMDWGTAPLPEGFSLYERAGSG